ncbi:hypothetical protein FH603_5413 [Spirosoma sp. LMG 31447]|uniref:Uncharacterized protein n=1 Tax=Spirosoma utsteinense TaxID=2585773 RepID=A0ABR6WEA1_9BACT|nr:hypothetical protein [Spirosoma utsteinense]
MISCSATTAATARLGYEALVAVSVVIATGFQFPFYIHKAAFLQLFPG